MSCYTKAKFIVAVQYPSKVWDMYSGCDGLRDAINDMNVHTPENHGERYRAVGIFTRGQWHAQDFSRPLYLKKLRDNNDPIPSSLGMWAINQADSGYF